MNTRKLRNRNALGIGEAMLEFTPLGEDRLYRRGSAGDALNTCWQMSEILGDQGPLGNFTRVGTGPFSAQLLDFIATNGLDVSRIARDPNPTIGLWILTHHCSVARCIALHGRPK